MRNDENILDFTVEDAEFYVDSFGQVPNGSMLQQALKNRKGFFSLVTVDFFNHNSETTQIAEGTKPNYQTQFAFKNLVDHLFVNHLEKRTLRMDVYASLNN